MAVLRERVRWERTRAQNETRRSSDLTPEEQEATRVAIRFLAKRFGSFKKLSTSMRANVELAASKRGTVSAGIALRVARAAGVPLEDVLAGRFPAKGACPHCGRT